MSRTHGNASTYRDPRFQCRCEACTEAHRLRQRDEQADRARRLAADPSLAVHGKVSTYKNWLCRCQPCSDANAADCREYKTKRRARMEGAA